MQDGLMQLLFAMLCLEAVAESSARSGGDDPVSLSAARLYKVVA
jgi:hypothetical protein